MARPETQITAVQKQVIKLTYQIMLLSLLFWGFARGINYFWSVLLGTMLSLQQFNSKFALIKKGLNKKFIGKQTANHFVSYTGLFLVLVFVKVYTPLNVWLVLGYSFLCNILLIFVSIFNLKNKKGRK